MDTFSFIVNRFTSRPESLWGFVVIIAIGLAVILASDGKPGSLAVDLILYLLLISAAVYDWKYNTIPNPIVAGGGVVACCLLAIGHLDLHTSMAAGFAVTLIFLSLRWIGLLFLKQPGFGMGDLKLFVVLGLFLGWKVLWILYLSIMLAALAAMVGIIFGKLNRKSRIPFAPYILAASLSGMFILPPEILLGLSI